MIRALLASGMVLWMMLVGWLVSKTDSNAWEVGAFMLVAAGPWVVGWILWDLRRRG